MAATQPGARQPWRPCAQPGCPTLVRKGRCAAHERAAEATRRSEAWRQLYQEPRWKRRRRAFLRRHPLCFWCDQEGIATPSQAVDHEPAHQGDRAAFYDESTWRASCTSCNSRRANQARRRPAGGQRR